ncbi:MAG: hypothetical protein HOB18_09960 [Nitrospina sp.]|jgi:hypothetical protein|nr:hypothetical protein [Nitrospina sp.]MBT6717942.1 hypothetical protein [Nitrospina sp.]
MEDSTHNQKKTENRAQPKAHPSPKYSFEEDLRRKNIDTMLEIYGEEYMAKVGDLIQQ